MPIPSSMADLSTTAASNSPAGSESPTAGDDFLRAIQAILRTTNAKGADIASASTTDIGAATGEFVDITGTATITALGTVAAGIVRTVRFTGALTLTHNATSLILPGSVNITTANGDVAQFRSLGSGNWKCVGYIPQAGYARPGANGDITSLTACTNITATAVTGATDDKILIQDTSDSDKLKTILVSSLAASAASETVAGIVELATNAEVITGTDTARAVTPASMKAGLNASGTAPTYACRAWVNFNGVTASFGINASGNVSSVTDSGDGRYSINFTTALPDANYVVCGGANTTSVPTADEKTATVGLTRRTATPLSTTAALISVMNDLGGASESSIITVAIFR